MVEMAIDGHLSDRELRKYSSAVTGPRVRERMPMTRVSTKYPRTMSAPVSTAAAYIQ